MVIFLRVNVCPTEKLFRRSSPLPVDRKATPELQLLPDPRAQPNENDRIYRILKVVEKVGIDKLDEMVENLENPEKSPKNISALLKLGHFSEKEFAKKHREECEKKQILEDAKNKKKELPGLDARKAAQMHRGKISLLFHQFRNSELYCGKVYPKDIKFRK